MQQQEQQEQQGDEGNTRKGPEYRRYVNRIFASGERFESFSHLSIQQMREPNARIRGRYRVVRHTVPGTGVFKFDRWVAFAANLALIVAAVLNVVDMVSDLVVAAGFYRNNDTSWFLISILIMMASTSLTVYLLWRQGRPHVAFMQLFSLGGVYDAVLLVMERDETVTIGFADPAPMMGKESVQRLKMLESLLESTPQLLLQAYVALLTSFTPSLVFSIVLSIASLGLSLAMSDRVALGANSAKDRQRLVEMPWLISRVVDAKSTAGCTCCGVRIR